MIPNEVTLKLGKFIEHRRKQYGISEYDFAQALDESVLYVRQAEQGMIDVASRVILRGQDYG